MRLAPPPFQLAGWVAQLVAQPLAMRVAEADDLLATFMSADAGASVFAPLAAARDRRRADLARSAGAGDLALIGVYGTIVQRLPGWLEQLTGAFSSTIRIAAQLRYALDDDDVRAIVLDIDSPGGSVYGVQALADELYRARMVKPVIAIANSVAASAAYWLASQASELYVAPGGEVGSIGVYATHRDISKALEIEGVKYTLISAGKHKTELSSVAPLSDEARDFALSRVNEYHGQFSRDVARGRGVPVKSVMRGMGEGRTVGANQAMIERMIDGQRTLEDVIYAAASGNTPLADQRRAAAIATRHRLASRALELDLVGTYAPRKLH